MASASVLEMSAFDPLQTLAAQNMLAQWPTHSQQL